MRCGTEPCGSPPSLARTDPSPSSTPSCPTPTQRRWRSCKLGPATRPCGSSHGASRMPRSAVGSSQNSQMRTSETEVIDLRSLASRFPPHDPAPTLVYVRPAGVPKQYLTNLEHCFYLYYPSLMVLVMRIDAHRLDHLLRMTIESWQSLEV